MAEERTRTGGELVAELSQRRTEKGAILARLAREFESVFNVETIERFIDDSVERLSGAHVTTFRTIFAERFARDRLRALARVEDRDQDAIPSVLFLCVHNAGRSQMAAGWARKLAGEGVIVWSGGSEPTDSVNMAAVEAMAEIGVDMSLEFPKPWTDEVVQAADVVVTMGCGDACPIYPSKRYIDWEIPDPHEANLETVRVIRDELGQRVRQLLDELGVEATT